MRFIERILLRERARRRDGCDPEVGERLRHRLAVRIRAEESQRADKLPIGTVVDVLLDDDRLKRTTVRLAPWQLGHGQWVVGLDGFTGGYDVMRCYPVLEEVS